MAIRDLKARVVLTADTKGLTRGFRTAETSVTSFSSAASKLGALAAGGGAIALAIKGFDELQKAANLSAQAEALRRTLGEVGQDFDGFIAKLQEVSAGTVSTADLIGASSRALLLSIPAEQIADLLEVARTRAIATGQDVGTAFNDISVGIGRLSPLILDNLGFTIRLSDAYGAYADAVGKTTEELNKQEQQQAVINIILEQGRESTELFGDAAAGTAEQLQRLTASFTNLTDAAGKLAVEQSSLPIVLSNTALTVEQLTGTIEGNLDSLIELGKRSFILGQDFTLFGIPIGLLVNKFFDLKQAAEDAKEGLDNLIPPTKNAADAAAELDVNLTSLVAAGFSTAEAMELLADSQERLLRIEKELSDETAEFTDILGKLNIKTDDELNESLGKLNDALEFVGDQFRAGRISEEQFERTTVRVTAEILKLETQLANTAPEFLRLKEAIDETSEAEDELTESTGRATEAHRQLELQSVRTRSELARAAEQARVTAFAFDQIERAQGRAAAEAAALAGGGRLILGGTRIELPGGGSRLVRTRSITNRGFGINPASGSSRRQSRFFDNLSTIV